MVCCIDEFFVLLLGNGESVDIIIVLNGDRSFIIAKLKFTFENRHPVTRFQASR